MHTIGVIGGLSWVSTAEYYRAINVETQRRLGGVNSARLLLASVNREDYVREVIEREDEAAAFEIILDAARALERGGADFLVIACNDVHRFVPALEREVALPFLHIVDATAAAIVASGLDTVALLGVRKTMELDFYPDRLTTYGIEALVPDEADRSRVHESIYEELVHDVFTDETRAQYVEIIGRLAARGAQGIVLGCTEIPLLLSSDDVEVPLFSTTELHCRAAVARAIDHGDI